MSLHYLKSSQIIPNQGMSYTLYEIEGEDIIVRMLTYIPDVNKVSLYDKPPIKKLFAPERCETATKDEFTTLWKKGKNLGS